jgi:hypothetical protein
MGAASLHAGGRARAIRRAVKGADNSAGPTRGVPRGLSRPNRSRAAGWRHHRWQRRSSRGAPARRLPRSGGAVVPAFTPWPPSRTAAVCAFSLTSCITQRDGMTGRDAPGSRTLLYPGDPGPHRPAPPRRSRAPGRLPEPRHTRRFRAGVRLPAPDRPGSAGIRSAARPSRSPVPEPGGIRACRPAPFIPAP